MNSLLRGATSLAAAVLGRGAPTPWAMCTRGRKRRGVALMRKAKEAKSGKPPVLSRRKREKLKAAKTTPFIEKVRWRQGSNLSSPSLQYPARVDGPTPTLQPPLDDVHVASFYREPVFTVAQAVEMHRELMHPTMYNCPSAGVRLRLELNMNTEKMTKFVHSSQHVLLLPHMSEVEKKRDLMVFAKDLDAQKAAVEAGVEMVGGAELIKKVMKGVYRHDDYDYFIANADIAGELVQMRNLLREKFPTKLNGAIGTDMAKLVEKFSTGVPCHIHADPKRYEWGMCDGIVAKLDMPTEAIEENIAFIIDHVCKQRPLSAKLGHFINRALLMVQPSVEYFAIDFAKYSPPIPKMTAAQLAKEEEKKAAEVPTFLKLQHKRETYFDKRFKPEMLNNFRLPRFWK